MIDIVGGGAIPRLLEKVARTPELYRRVVIASPFLDRYGWDLIKDTCLASERRVPTLTMVLRPDAVQRVADWAPDLMWRIDMVVRWRLHAKFYALLGIRRVAHEAIITSSNLTAAGISRNLELGLILRGRTERLALTVEHLSHRLTR